MTDKKSGGEKTKEDFCMVARGQRADSIPQTGRTADSQTREMFSYSSLHEKLA